MQALFTLAGVISFLCVAQATPTTEIRLINVGFADTGWIVFAIDTPSFDGVVGNYDINISNGTSVYSANPSLELSSVDSTPSSNPGTLIIETMANDYTGSAQFAFAVSGTNNLGGPIEFKAYGGNNNQICPAGVNSCSPSSITILDGDLGPFNTSSYLASIPGISNSVDPYSLGIVVTLDAGEGSAKFDATLSAVPEPSSVALLVGVIVLTMAVRRKLPRPAKPWHDHGK